MAMWKGGWTVGVLEIVVVVLVILWLLGAFVVPVGGSAVHLLLVIVLVLILYRVLTGRSAL